MKVVVVVVVAVVVVVVCARARVHVCMWEFNHNMEIRNRDSLEKISLLLFRSLEISSCPRCLKPISFING